jgi:hypothetical protein
MSVSGLRRPPTGHGLGNATANRVCATCAIGGSLLLSVGTYLHPQSADPNDTVAAFTEYAADHLWVASHLIQLAGVALMVVALLFLMQRLETERASLPARLASGVAIASLAVAMALQAVDGVALKRMVDAWAEAPDAAKAIAFRAAFAVRQIEIGLACMLCLSLGAAATLCGVTLLVDGAWPRWICGLAIIGGVATSIAGVAIAYTGFSDLVMMINMPANSLLLLWMLAVGVHTWRLEGR